MTDIAAAAEALEGAATLMTANQAAASAGVGAVEVSTADGDGLRTAGRCHARSESSSPGLSPNSSAVRHV